MAALAKEYGVRVEVEVEGAIVRIVPDNGVIRDEHGDDDPHASIKTLDAWRKRHPARSHWESQTGPSGYPIVSDPNHLVQKWYDKLGFDVQTMSEADMERLQKEAHDKWEISVRAAKLNKREGKVLEAFAVHGPNMKISAEKIKCGPDTEERLLARGFIETFPQEKFPDRVGAYMLTDAGYEAWKSKQ